MLFHLIDKVYDIKDCKDMGLENYSLWQVLKQ